MTLQSGAGSSSSGSPMQPSIGFALRPRPARFSRPCEHADSESIIEVSDVASKRTRPRADRVLPGIWRLRLPLPWPGVPHVNAFAIRAGDGLVLFDTGIGEPGSIEELDFALAQAGWRLEQVSLLVCTH